MRSDMPFTPGAKDAEAADDEIDLHARPGCLVERLDELGSRRRSFWRDVRGGGLPGRAPARVG